MTCRHSSVNTRSGCQAYYHHPHASAITQWLEVLERDYSHPCIVGWCGANEESQPIEDRMQSLDDLQRGMFLAAKAMDPTRPVLDVSGHGHCVPETDVYDCHDYEQDPDKLAANHAALAEGRAFCGQPGANVPYRGQPFFVSEFGGIVWNPAFAGRQGNTETSWGYGEPPKSMEEFYLRFEGLCKALMDHPHIFGFCYTQLTDTYQEQNGIVFFDRTPKFDFARLRAALTRPAVIERAADSCFQSSPGCRQQRASINRKTTEEMK